MSAECCRMCAVLACALFLCGYRTHFPFDGADSNDTSFQHDQNVEALCLDQNAFHPSSSGQWKQARDSTLMPSIQKQLSSKLGTLIVQCAQTPWCMPCYAMPHVPHSRPGCTQLQISCSLDLFQTNPHPHCNLLACGLPLVILPHQQRCHH